MSQQPIFDVVLYPNASLSQRGFVALMVAFGVCGGGLSVICYLMGAWPVFGFMGLDFLVIWLMVRHHIRQGGRREYIQLTPQTLRVSRVCAQGLTQTVTFLPCWARIEMLEPKGQSEGFVVISSHGNQTRIGGFLTQAERRSLAQALGQAVDEARRYYLQAPHAALPGLERVNI